MTTVFSEGDVGTFDLSEGSWRNETTGATGTVTTLPQLILDIIASGGVLPRLGRAGLHTGRVGRCAAIERGCDAQRGRV